MDNAGVFPMKNHASNLTALMLSIVDSKTKQPLMLRNNYGFSNFASSNFASRNGFFDEASSDRKGKRKVVSEIDFFSSEKRKMPKLEPGIVSSSVPRIKEEDITLQIGLQFTGSSEEDESLQQAYKRVAKELAVTKAQLRRMGEEKNIMTEEINQLKNMVTSSENYFYQIATLHKGNQGSSAIPNRTLKRMLIEKQHKENYQVSETDRRLRLV